MKNKKGFTLTELLAVIAIIAILAVAAMSGYSAMTNNSKQKALEQKKSQIELAAEKYAKETNMNGTATISVNRLVVMGYLQPDSSTDDGYSVITNPVNSENMICDLVTISANHDLVKASYVDGSKDCNIARTDEVDARIDIRAYEYNRTTPDQIAFISEEKKYAWTRDSVLIFVTSEYFDPIKYANNKAIKVTYEYGGNSVDKLINDSNKVSTASSNRGTKYNQNTYNEFLIPIDDIGLLFDREVSVIITMKDGTTHVKGVNIRIDLEPPTGYLVVNNDFITTDSRREVKLFYDDSNGSGVAGYAVSETENGGVGLNFGAEAPDKIISDKGNGGTFKIGLKGIYYVYVKDKVGNISKPIILNNNNFDIPKDQILCYLKVYNTSGTELSPIGPGWYNRDIIIKAQTVNPIGSIGLKDKLLKKPHGSIQEKELTTLLRDLDANGVMDTYTLTTEIDLTEFANGMKSLQRNSEIRTCYNEKIGLDKTPPEVAFTYNNHTGYNEPTQKHTVDITFTDNLSGFIKTGSTGLSFQYGWSLSKTTEPTSWITADAAIQTNVRQAKVTITSDTTDNIHKLTGVYYFWIRGNYTQDLAQNKMGAKVLDYGFKFDNTAPICTTSGGSPNWTNQNVTIYGACQDTGSVQSGCIKKTISGYTYDNGGNVSKTYSNEINSEHESPGTVYDKAGNSTVCNNDRIVRIDKTNPTCTLSLSSVTGSNGWYNTDVTVTISRNDTGGSGVETYGLSSTNSVTYNNKESDKHTTNTTNKTWYGFVKDRAGNTGSCESTTFKVDKTPPTCSVSKTGTMGDNSWYRSNVTLTLTKNDTGGSNIDTYGLATSTTPGYNKKETDVQSTDTLGVTWYGFVRDNAGNTVRCDSGVFKIDKTAPTCSVTPSGTTGDNGWYRSDVTLSLATADSGGSNVYAYGLSASNSAVYNNKASDKNTTNTTGTKWYGFVKDTAGNTNSCESSSFKMDKTAPTCSVTPSGTSGLNGWFINDVTLTLGTNDVGGSNVASYGLGNTSSVSYNSKTSDTHSSETTGSIWYGVVKDGAGNTNSCNSVAFKLDKTNPVCTISHSGLASGDNGWLKKNGNTTTETVYFTVSDSNGLSQHYFGTNSGGSYRTFSGFTQSGGNYSRSNSQGNTAGVTWYGKIKDNAGRTNTCDTGSFKVDVSAPTVSTLTVASRDSNYHTTSVDITVAGSDAGNSGVSKACVQTSNDVSQCTWRDFTGNNKYENIAVASAYDGSTVTVYAWIKDAAGNISDVKPKNYTVYTNCTKTQNDGAYTCGTYSACTVTCGGGDQYATKTQNKKDKYTGAACSPVVTENGCYQRCNTQSCNYTVTVRTNSGTLSKTSISVTPGGDTSFTITESYTSHYGIGNKDDVAVSCTGNVGKITKGGVNLASDNKSTSMKVTLNKINSDLTCTVTLPSCSWYKIDKGHYYLYYEYDSWGGEHHSSFCADYGKPTCVCAIRGWWESGDGDGNGYLLINGLRSSGFMYKWYNFESEDHQNAKYWDSPSACGANNLTLH